MHGDGHAAKAGQPSGFAEFVHQHYISVPPQFDPNKFDILDSVSGGKTS